MVDKTDDKYAKLQRALKHVNKVQNSVDTARKKSGVDRIATDKHGNTVYKKEVKEMKKDKAPSSSKQNPVAKHMRTFNKATVQRDRKKDAKRGYKKHSNAYENMQIDELSDDGLHSYISKSMNASDDAFRKKQKAHNNANNAAERGQMTRHKSNKSAVKHFSAIQKKRDAGIQQALKKVTGRAKVNATESVEQVDELSVDTLSRYNSKASKDPKRAKMNNKAVGKIVKKTMQGENVEQVDEQRVIKFNPKTDHKLGSFKKSKQTHIIAKKSKRGYDIHVHDSVSGKSNPVLRGVSNLGQAREGLKRPHHTERFSKAGGVNWHHESMKESVEQVQESTGHVRMDRLSASGQKKVVAVLKSHEKNGSIKHDGDTDKGASFKLLKPNHQSKIHSDLRKHGTGFDMHESVEQLAEDKTLTRDQLPKKVEAVVKKVFKVIKKHKKPGKVSVHKFPKGKYTVFIAVGRDNGREDEYEDYTGDLISIIPWEKRKTSNIEIDIAASMYPAPKNIIRESLDNAKSEKDSAQMKLRHANQKVRLAKKQEREKGAVAERKETESAAKKPEKYTKADGTIGTRMVPAHKDVQKESAEQVEEGIAHYKIHRSNNNGRTWDHSPGDSYVSLSRAREISGNMKHTGQHTPGFKVKITKHKKTKLAGPVGKLPESVEQVEEAYFSVQFRDEKGKADSSSKNFKSASAAKKHADMANKTTKVGSYSVQKVQGRMESVEHIEEGLLNDIRDFIVAVGASVPTKKNKQNKGLEGQIRSAMQEDPEFDKLVRNAAYVRKDGIVAFKAGSLSELQAYVRKTVDAKTADKLGTLVQGYMETMRSGEKKNIRRSSNFTKKQKAGIKSGKIVYTADMERTLQFTTDQIGKVIKRVTLAAHTKNMKEDVEQVDELSDKLLKRYDRKSATSARNLRKKMDKVVDTVKKSKSGVATTNQLDRYSKAMDKHSNRMDGANRSQQTQLRRAMGESVEQVDENMFGYEGKNKIKIYHSDAKVHKSAVGSFPDHHSAEFDKKKKTTTIHLKKSVDKDTAGKIGRFDSNWKTRTSYHESTEYEDVIAEALSNVVVKKMQDMVGGPANMPRGAEFRKLKAKAQAAVKAERSAKKAAPKAVTTTKTAKGKTHKGSADASERNIIMQLRKAQDLDGNSEVRISPKRSVKLSKKKIDALLKKHDALQKPVQKRAYIVMLTKALRGMK